jgi:antitoxin component YwqK of YwqJK toxin-antitoxin module
MYKNGKLTGDYLVYYPNGHIQVAGHFHEDERHGKWLYYDKDDSVKLELNYHYDKLLNEDELTGKQQEFFRHTDRNMNKFNEPRLRDFYRSDTDEY